MRRLATGAALSLAMIIVGCARTPEEIAISGPAMGSTYTVKVVQPPVDVDAYALRRMVDETLASIDLSMSGYRPDSEIARFNAAQTTEWVSVSAQLAEVVALAMQVSEASEGAFDVTIAPLVDAWGFGPSGAAAAAPDDATLATLRDRIGYRKLHVKRDPAALRKDIATLEIDLNGVAPGYAVDQIAARLHARGVRNFMIEIGGEVRVRGANARGAPWRVAVERPFEVEGRPYAILELRDLAVTTSGEYRRFEVRGGERVSHTIDPSAARPVRHDLAAVVVVGEQAANVDAWATAYNVMGPERGYELALRLGMAVMFIVSEGDALTHRATPAFAPYMASEVAGSDQPREP